MSHGVSARAAYVALGLTLLASVPLHAQSVRRVPAGDSLQAALDAAQPGDTITLAPGVTYVGNFVLPVKSGADFITIRSAADANVLPPHGSRVNPAYSPHLAKLQSPNNEPALRTAAGAHHFRIECVEFLANRMGAGDIIALGDGSARQHSLDLVPYALVLDRVYVHGDPALGQKRGIGLNSASTTIVNSYIAEIKAVGQDSQAIGGWNGPGPYVISNNYLEAAGENVMFGGADPWIEGLVPSDITFTLNHVAKPLSWRGSQWSVKNLFELKNAQRVVIDRNLFENNWVAAQTGYAILLKSVNQDGRAPWSVVQDVQFTNNVVRSVSSAINILGRDTNHAAIEANRITVRNNLFTNVSGRLFGGSGRLLLINGGAQIVFEHNTAISDGSSTIYADGHPVAGFTFLNNVILDNTWGLMGSGTGEGKPTLAAYFPGAVFSGNIVAGANAGAYPSANFYPAITDVGFVDYAGGDYRLAESSPYKHAATTGADPGVHFASLAAPSAPSAPSAPNAPSAPSAPSAPGAPGAPGAPNAPSAPSAPMTAAATTDAPHQLTASVVGATVILNWSAPVSPGVLQYLVEAGSSPASADIAQFLTGGATTSLIAQAVPDGIYHVRVRAITANGTGSASPDLVVVVGVATCAALPSAPTALTASVQNGTVQLTWDRPQSTCGPTHYVVQAGSASLRSDLAQITATAEGLVASAPAGQYFVRVIAMSPGGVSPASDEVIVTVP